MLERLRTDFINIPNAFANSQTIIVTAVGFLAITWAFTQIIFPRLKKLDKLQDELFEFAVTNNELYRNDEEDNAREERAATELNQIFLRYENVYMRAIRTALSAATGYTVFSSVIILLSTKNNYSLTLTYFAFASITIIAIIHNYPSQDKVRSIKYLVRTIGFNPWVLWGLMQPGLFFSTEMDRYWSKPANDEVKFTLKQRVFLTGWIFYLQVSTYDNNKVWLISSGEVTINDNTQKHYSDYGVQYYQDMGNIRHSKLDVPLRNGLREFKASLVVMAPVFKNEAWNPFAVADYQELKSNTRGFIASATSINIRNPNVINSIEINGIGSKFKVRLTENTSQIVNVKILKSMAKNLNSKVSFTIKNQDGELEKITTSKVNKFYFFVLRATGVHKFNRVKIGKFKN